MRGVPGHTSPSQHEADLRDLLRRAPLVVGRESELPQPGEFFTHDDAGVALLVTRDAAGRLHAMLNVCSHRGTRLVYESRGTACSFVCRYHGWTYDLGGRLGRPGRVGLPPALEQFMGDRALTEVPSEARHGFLWVLPTPRTTLDLRVALGPLDDRLAALDLGSHGVVAERTIETHASNWKHVVDGLVVDDAGVPLPDRLFVPPNSILVPGDGAVSHLEVFPRAVEESIVVTTRLTR
jgi:phenylpropionate dioxygenase-like ring-hydroxylating dioxygenase large terminal subunit